MPLQACEWQNVANIRNIKKLQNQGLIRRVGPDKGGFWEVISEDSA